MSRSHQRTRPQVMSKSMRIVLVDLDGDVLARRRKWFQGDFHNVAQSSLEAEKSPRTARLSHYTFLP